jgi:NADH:ubiquinone oxidoreductase subunit H
MTIDATDVVLSVLKIAIVLGIMLQVTPIMAWVERRGSALIQDRPGPNRVGPFGLIQAFADALKFILKEDIIPAEAHKWLYTLAPTFGLIPALTTIAVVPWGRPFRIPDAIVYAGPVSIAGWSIAALSLLLGFISGAATSRYGRKRTAIRFNVFVGWLVTALLVGSAFVIGAILIYLRSRYMVSMPAAGRLFEPIVANVNVGILVIFALASLGVYGIVTAGWASNNKYSMFGAIRASAQMISYELSLTLAAISVLLAAGSLRLTDVVVQQTGTFRLFDAIALPAWNVFSPAMWLSFIIFFVSSFAETNRLPFDFAEAEAELVAGYHTEYSSMKFALFFMAEYMAMFTMAAVVTTLFLGGWDVPYYNEPPTFLGFLASFLAFLAKAGFLMFVFVWVRWTIPRLKYDILMRIGWKVFLPLAVANIVLVALFMARGWV